MTWKDSMDSVFQGMNAKILEGDCRASMRRLPPNLFHACVTSPPYLGLRDYKVKGQIGLEKSPAEFLRVMVEVFDEVRRVLRDDGVLWVNVGDTYSNESKHGGTTAGKHIRALHGGPIGRAKRFNGIPSLNLLMIPSQLALALRDSGWYLRASIVWQKPAPMPESVTGTRWERCRVKISGTGWQPGTHPSANMEQSKSGTCFARGRENSMPIAEWTDCPGCRKCSPNDGLVLRRGSWRPTRSHEMIYMFAKTANYYADGEAVRQPSSDATINRLAQDVASQNGSDRVPGKLNGNMKAVGDPVAGANLRDVWTIGPEPLSLPHYAAFPSELPYRCLKASTSARGVCCACGGPWARVVDSPFRGEGNPIPYSERAERGSKMALAGHEWRARQEAEPSKTIGWRPTCTCAAPCVPAAVLDPFSGAGTTVLAALRLGCYGLGCELNPDYAAMARKRIVDESPLFNVCG